MEGLGSHTTELSGTGQEWSTQEPEDSNAPRGW